MTLPLVVVVVLLLVSLLELPMALLALAAMEMVVAAEGIHMAVGAEAAERFDMVVAAGEVDIPEAFVPTSTFVPSLGLQ